jgi:hypothetical protein
MLMILNYTLPTGATCAQSRRLSPRVHQGWV